MAQADNDNQHDMPAETATEGRRQLSPAAERALKEAEERRAAERSAQMPTEFGGRGGADPSRFGDWEINGRAIDF